MTSLSGFDRDAGSSVDSSERGPWNSRRHSNRYRSYRPYYNNSYWWWRPRSYYDYWDYLGTDNDNTNEVEEEKPEVEENKPEEEDKPEVEEPKPKPKKLKITVDFQTDVNREAHRTNTYGVKNLVVRRGQEIHVKVKINKSFDKDEDHLQFIFLKGETPQVSKKTLFKVDVYKDEESAKARNLHDWKAYITASKETSSGDTEIDLAILPAADAPVGTYKVNTKYFRQEAGSGEKNRHLIERQEEIYILFNAWCEDDDVYMEDEEERKEYVMNETGRIWTGSAWYPRSKPWNFGQFSSYCLRAAVYLLQKSYLDDKAHGNVTEVCRALSAMVNSNDDDNGVLSGNWSGDYEGGTSPTKWNGSQAILEEYITNKKDVKWGQCWVFSGVLTTVARSLGIPTRSVTNFDSAHDTDYSMTIDTHYDEEGEPLKHLDDSVWNFHVWNESWFKRPDLPEGYDGWQAYDATPQEASGNMMRCGPASIKCIKEGNVYLGYDSKFIFGEVNGERVTWIVKPDNTMEIKRSRYKPEPVGSKISTKAVGSKERHDLTLDYKYKEGSEEEKKALQNAAQYSSRSKYLEDMFVDVQEDVKFEYNREISSGGDIHVTLSATNNADAERNIKLRISSHAAYYTGMSAEEISDEKMEVKLQPGKSITKDWSLKAKDYLNVIDEDGKIKIYVVARVKETKEFFTKDEIFSLDKPDLDMTVSNEKPKVGESFNVTISFTNPVEVQLTKGEFSIEGPGIQKPLKIPLNRPVEIGETVTENVTLTPKYPGNKEIIAGFNSRQLVDLTGSVEVEVQAA